MRRRRKEKKKKKQEKKQKKIKQKTTKNMLCYQKKEPPNFKSQEQYHRLARFHINYGFFGKTKRANQCQIWENIEPNKSQEQYHLKSQEQYHLEVQKVGLKSGTVSNSPVGLFLTLDLRLAAVGMIFLKNVVLFLDIDRPKKWYQN